MRWVLTAAGVAGLVAEVAIWIVTGYQSSLQIAASLTLVMAGGTANVLRALDQIPLEDLRAYVLRVGEFERL